MKQEIEQDLISWKEKQDRKPLRVRGARQVGKTYVVEKFGREHFSSFRKKFKLLFLDVGLVLRACHLDLQLIMHEDLMLINRGAIAEQFVGQELLAYLDRYEPRRIYFGYEKRKEAVLKSIM